jgi:uncharacterized protein YjdB
MMKSFTAFLITNFLFISVSFAETYTWTDSKGTVHFTEDLGTVPEKLRNKVRKIDDTEQPQSTTKAATGTQQSSGAAISAGDQSPGDLYGGKSYDQWHQELADSETALISVRKRIDEFAELLKSARAKSEEQKNLVAEYNQLLEKFKTMKAEYYQLVGAARKAGLTVNIQEQ